MSSSLSYFKGNINQFFGLKLALVQFIFLLFSFSLFIDSINGYFLSGMGIDPKLSAAYKLLMICLILLFIGSYSLLLLRIILSSILILMVGPILTLFDTLNGAGLVEDFVVALKLVTPFITFIFCVLVSQINPYLMLKYGKIACFLSFWILVINIVLGALGYGFSTYGVSNIGVKGFFYAGNEVSGLYVVFFGIILHWLWQKSNKTYYFVFSVLTLISGVLIATKAAMMAGALLVYLIPVFNERNRFLNLTYLKLKLIFPIIILAVVLVLYLIPILEATGLWGRLVWFYEKKGLVGLLFSGRDEFIKVGLDAFYKFATFPQFIFGLGQTGLGTITKASMEIDPMDMFLWFGVVGLLFYTLLITLFLRVSYLATICKESLWGPSILVINIVLIALSIIAGHTYTSGMLGPFIGVINGIAYADWCICMKNKSSTQIKNS